MSLPVGWERFSNYGTTINNLFLPHKVPLKENMTRNTPESRFTTQDLMDRFPRLGMVIDLTQTGNASRYYQPTDLEENGIKHVKITVRGGGFVPESSQVEEFINLVDDFRSNNRGKLIGVHCTHGLNRTGFMICSYLIRKHGISGHDALKIFEEARGHRIERETYVDEILSHSAKHGEPVGAKPREPVGAKLREPVSANSFSYHDMTGDNYHALYRGYEDRTVPVEYRQRTRVFYNSDLTEAERWEVDRTLRPVLQCPVRRVVHHQHVPRSGNDAGNGNGEDSHHEENHRWDKSESWARNVSLSMRSGQPFRHHLRHSQSG